LQQDQTQSPATVPSSAATPAAAPKNSLLSTPLPVTDSNAPAAPAK
jgi:hypothetical protein